VTVELKSGRLIVCEAVIEAVTVTMGGVSVTVAVVIAVLVDTIGTV
jgi:hypothetical protein